MNVKTSRPLPPIPSTSSPKITKKTTTSPVQKTVAKKPPLKTHSPQTAPKPLGTPEEKQQIQHQIEQTPPEVMQKNASRIPPISTLDTQMIRSQQLTSNYRQHMSKMPQNTVKLTSFALQQRNGVTVESQEVLQMLQKHQHNEFSRQMKMSGVLALPREIQLAQRPQLAIAHQQERSNEARELMQLRQSQMGTDTSQLPSITQEFDDSMQKVALLTKAETVNGKSGEAYAELSQRSLRDTEKLFAQKGQLMSDRALLSTEAHQQQQKLSEVNYRIDTTETALNAVQNELDFIVSSPPPEKRPENQMTLRHIEKERQNYDKEISRYKELPHMSSVKLKSLMIEKDRLMVNFKKEMQQIHEKEQVQIQDLQQQVKTHQSTLSTLNQEKESLTSQLETTKQSLQKNELTRDYLDIQIERKQLESVGFQLLALL